MPQKLVIDADPGVGDALAISLALLDPELDVVAVTAVGGRVSASQAGQNLWSLVEAIDPPKRPRFGVNDTPESQYELVRFSERLGDEADLTRKLNGEHGLGDWPLGDAQRHHPRSAAKLMIEVSREFPGEVTFVTLGPLTTIALAAELDAEFLARIQGLVCSAGAVVAPGDITPAAEFNVCFNPESARRVLRSPSTKTLVPLDVGRKAVITFEQVQRLGLADETPRGRMLQSLLSYSLRAHHQYLGMEGCWLHEAAAIAALARPAIFTRQPLSIDVETDGQLTRGMTIFDRRQLKTWRPNIDVLIDVDAQGLHDYVMGTLRHRS